MASVNSSHQGSGVKLKNDMLQEDQQVGRPVLQLLNVVKVGALVVRYLKVRHEWERNENAFRRKSKKQKENGCVFLSTHIIEIILKILILSPNDAHGWVRALSPKHALL